MKCCVDKNDEKKIVYVVLREDKDKVYVKGLYYRVERYIFRENVLYLNEIDLEKFRRENDDYYKKIKENIFSIRVKGVLGTVLHVDGDEEYMQNCIELYKEMGIHAYGIYMDEKEMPKKIGKIVRQLLPDIVVITGHDYYNGEGKTNLKNYKNTENFIAACLECKRNKIDCVVIAGACQSNSEALLVNGANYASSPQRINVHTFDPAIIAVKVASTSSERYIDNLSLTKKIENFKDAYTGIETKGKMKILI